MCKVIAITNQKGGCAKTNVTVNLGIGLAREGKKVALIDNDAQGSLTASLGYEEPDELNITLANIMMNVINDEENEPEYGFLQHEEGVSFIPANVELSGLEISLINVISRETILRSYIETIRDQYDYILIDCAPSLGMLTINALVAADAVIIPVPAAYLPVKGLVQLLKTISMVKRRLNRKLQIEGILITMADFRTNFAKGIAKSCTAFYNKVVLNLCKQVSFLKGTMTWQTQKRKLRNIAFWWIPSRRRSKTANMSPASAWNLKTRFPSSSGTAAKLCGRRFPSSSRRGLLSAGAAAARISAPRADARRAATASPL